MVTIYLVTLGDPVMVKLLKENFNGLCPKFFTFIPGHWASSDLLLIKGYLVSLGDPVMVKLLKENFMGSAHCFFFLKSVYQRDQTFY